MDDLFEDKDPVLEGYTAVDMRDEETALPTYYEAPISIERGIVERDAIEEWQDQARSAPQDYYQGMVALVCSLACKGLREKAKKEIDS